MRELVAACLLYAATALTLPFPLGPSLVGLVSGALAGRRRGALTALAACALGWLAGPPQWIIFDAFYWEPSYVRVLGHSDPFWGVLLAAAVAFLAGLPAWTPAGRRRLAWGLALACAVNLLWLCALFPVFKGGLMAAFAQEPPAKSYTNDCLTHLKTVHLIKQGHDYYRATILAIEQDGRSYDNREFHSIRPPLLMTAMAQLPNPGWIVPAARVFACAALLAAFAATARLGCPLLALVVPYLLAAWSLYPLTSPFVIFSDFWAGLMGTVGFALYVTGWRRASISLFFLAFMFRELSVLTLVLGLVLALAGRQWREAAWWGAGLGLGGVLLVWHNYLTHTMMQIQSSTALVRRFNSDILVAFGTLRYGSVGLLGRDLLMPLLLVANVANLRHPAVRLLGAVVLAHFVAYCFVGQPGFSQYYGLNYSPLVIFGAGLALAHKSSEHTY